MRLGAVFHRLVERAESGINVDVLVTDLEDPLDQWFSAYLTHRPHDLPSGQLEIERTLAMPFFFEPDENRLQSSAPRIDNSSDSPGGFNASTYRLAAKYDLIAAEKDGPVVILDWKTTRRRTPASVLGRRLQTAVYPFVLVEASSALPWGPLKPEQIEMRYWFVAAPAQPVSFPYDSAQHEANRRRLQALGTHIITARSEQDFPLIPDTEENRRRSCAYCAYRSRCNRGVVPGELMNFGHDSELDLEAPEAFGDFALEDIDELSF